MLIARTLALCALAAPLAATTPGQRDQRTPVTDTRMMPTHSSDHVAPRAIDPCGTGTLIFTAGAGTRVGEETFRIDCKPDGSISANGRTQLTAPGGASDIATTIELDRSRLPKLFTAKGQAGGTSIDQRIEIANGTATIASGSARQQAPVPPDASFFASNVYYLLPLIAARYDATKGGEQMIPVWPLGGVAIAHVGEDRVEHDGKPALFERYTMRLGPQQLVLWFDNTGHVAVIAVPAQHFTAARQDVAVLAEPLQRLLAGASAPANAQPARQATAVDYSAPPGAPYTAEEVTVAASGYTLGGTLLLPKGRKRPHPAVVMITGSGQQDRDEALPLPGLERYRPFRQIAETLAAAGVAVLRVDDRGVGSSTGAETLTSATTRSFAEDTKLQVAYLRRRTDIDPARIALVGHSEGGIIAPMIAAADPRIAAIALLAGTARSGSEVSVEQLEALLASDTTRSAEQKAAMLAAQHDAVKKILAGEEIPGIPNMTWAREYFTYDPLPTIRRVRQPILILQGGRDQQVLPAHARLLASAAREAGNRDVTEHVYPTLNHLFLPSATGTVAEYASLEVTTLGDDVLGMLREWLTKRLGVDK